MAYPKNFNSMLVRVTKRISIIDNNRVRNAKEFFIMLRLGMYGTYRQKKTSLTVDAELFHLRVMAFLIAM